MSLVYLSLGTNLGNRRTNLETGIELLVSKGLKLLRSSEIYETEPWGFKEQPAFYNQVIEVATELDPAILLRLIHDIEKSCGRRRLMRYGPRPLDIDILFYDSLIHTAEDLKIPHPLIHARRFVLVPLADLVPELRHPVLGKTIRKLLTSCDDHGQVRKIQ